VHKELKALLPKATGRSEFIIALMIDIRGFTSFSMSRESSEAAIFLKKVYQTILDKYFPEAAFFKLTGDGLVIIVPYTEEGLKESCTNMVKKCLDLIRDFSSLCNGDPAIYFVVPRKVGIGLSRGAATCVISGDKVLDYSGRVLNLASRLTDIARPSGIVCDAKFGIELLPHELKEQFLQDSVYLRSIAENTPIGIYYTKEHTTIPAFNKTPIEETKWETSRIFFTLKQIKDMRPKFGYYLPTEPIDPKQIKVVIIHPKTKRGTRIKGISTRWNFRGFRYRLDAAKPRVTMNFKMLARKLRLRGVKQRWKVTIEVSYPKK